MNRFQDPIHSLEVTAQPFHRDHAFYPCGQVAGRWVWYKRGKTPIKDVQVLSDSDEAPGASWERLSLNTGKSSVAIWCQRGGPQSPIVDICVGSENLEAEGFQRSKAPLLDDIYVWFKTKDDSVRVGDPDKIFYIGARFDIKDDRIWRPAVVIEVNDAKIRVSYDGWTSKWDEDLRKESLRIAPLYRHSKGEWRGPGRAPIRPPFEMKDKLDEFEAHAHHLEDLLQHVLHKHQALPEADVDFLLKHEGYWYLQNCLHCALPTGKAFQTTVEAVQRYIQAYLQLAHHHLQLQGGLVNPMWLQVIDLALGGNLKQFGIFYKHYGLEQQPTVPETVCTSAQANSSYHSDNLNYFGQLGGFVTIARLLRPESQTSFTISSCILQLLLDIAPLLSPKFLATFVDQLDVPNVLKGLVRNITEDELRMYEHETIMKKIKSMASRLLSIDQKFTEQECGPFIERLELDLLDVVTTLGVFKQKMQAMTHLGRIIEAVVPPHAKRYLSEESQPIASVRPTGSYHTVRDRYGRLQQMWKPDPPPPPPVEHLTAQDVVTWLQECRLAERMLSQDSHEQLLRKTAPLLKFLAQQHKITAEHIELLWNSSAGAGEATVLMVQETLADLAQELSQDHLDLIFARIQQKPLARYKNHDLLFVKQFTVSAVRAGRLHARDSSQTSVEDASSQAQPLGSFYGLDLFWQASLGTDLPTDIQQQAFDFLKELLVQQAFATQREVYIQKCVDVLRVTLEQSAKASMLRVLELITHITTLSLEKDNVSQAIVELNDRYQLLDLVLNNAVLFSRLTYQELLGEDGQTSAAASSLDQVALSAQLETRSAELVGYLEFIMKSLKFSTLVLQPHQMDGLWTTFVDNAVQGSDADLLFQRMVECIAKAYSLLHEDCARRLFEKLSWVDPSRVVPDAVHKKGRPLVSLKSYFCFQLLFLTLNAKSGAVSSTHARTFFTVRRDLEGLESLWKYASIAADPEVSMKAADLLVSASIRFDLKWPRQEMQDSLTDFVQRSMALLADASKMPASTSQVRVVRQVVSLLDSFLRRLSTEEVVRRPLFRVGERIMALWRSNKHGIKYQAIIQGYNADGSYNVLYEDGDRDSCTPERNLLNADGLRRLPPEVDLTVFDVPKQLLAGSQEYFDLFFQLLGLDNATSQLVWALLSILPTNMALEAKMRALVNLPASEPIDWEQFLPSDSFVKLLYTLRIIRTLMNFAPVNSDSDLTDDSDDTVPEDLPALPLSLDHVAWRKLFVERGGFRHLYSSFCIMHDESLADSLLPKQSVISTLQILYHFLLGTQEQTAVSPAAAWQGVDGSRLALRLLACVHSVSQETLDDAAEKQDVACHSLLVSVMSDLLVKLLAMHPQEISQAVYSFPEWLGLLHNCLLKRFHPDLSQDFPRALASICESLKSAQDKLHQFEEDCDEESKVARLRRDHISLSSSSRNPMHCFFVPKLFKLLESADLKSPSLDFMPLFEFLKALLRDFEVTPDVLDVWPVARLLTQLLQQEPFEEDSSVPNALLEQLLSLSAALVAALPSASKFVLGIGGSQPDTGSGGALQADEDLINAIDSVGGTVELSAQNQNRGGTGLVVHLLRFLFDIPRSSSSSSQMSVPPKFKAKSTRRAGFALLAEICRGSPRDALVVVRGLMPNHLVTADNDTYVHDWAYEFREYEMKPRGAYVGLRNLGCICYMNSSLQQLFMIPQLRKNVLEIGDLKLDSLQTTVVYQLQHLFANLQESTESYVSPKNLTDIWIGENGQPVNVAKQEDSADFVNTLIDRVNENLKGTPFAPSLTSILRGQIADQIIGRGGCPHYREHSQPFNVLPVEIKGKNTLKEALDGFVQGELMAGDNKVNCEQCGHKQAVYKRQALKQLPPVLCINLKRFALDYETFSTVKINARLEFPMELDMKPYTIENMPIPEDEVGSADKSAGAADEGKSSAEEEVPELQQDEEDPEACENQQPQHPPEYYQYVLRGVVVHTGDVNRGHYYSYIQERSADPNKPGQWYCFNDNQVRPFDPRRLADCAFGGESSAHGHANAYLLFYDRKNPVPHIPPDEPEAKHPEDAEDEAKKPQDDEESNYAVVNSDGEEVNQEVCQMAAASSAKVPKSIFNDIWQQNITTARDKLVYDPDYFNFLGDLLAQIAQEFPPVADVHPRPVDLRTADLAMPVDLRDAAARLAARFFFKSLARCKHKDQLNPLGDILVKLFEKNVTAAAWMMWMVCLEPQWAPDFFINATWDNIRKIVGWVLSSSVAQVAPLEHDLLMDLVQDTVPEWPDGDDARSMEPGVEHAALLSRFARSASDVEYQASWDLESTPDAKVLRRDCFRRPSPKGYTASLLDTMVEILPVMVRTWWWNFDYFKVWANAMAADSACTAYASASGQLVALMDVWLASRSPHPVVRLPTARDGTRMDMTNQGYAAVHTNLDNWMVTVGHIVEHNVSTHGTPWASDADRDMLLSRHFVEWLFLESTTFERGQAVCKVLVPLAKNNAKATELLIQRLGQIISEADYDTARPVFRWLPSFLEMEDDLSEARRSRTMEVLLNSIYGVRKYWKDFDFYLAHLIRLCKVSPVALKYLDREPQWCECFCKWLKLYPEPPQPGSPEIRRFRPRPKDLYRMYRDWHEVNTFTSQYAGPHDMSTEDKLQAFSTLLAQGSFEPGVGHEAGYDSDSESWQVDFDLRQDVDARDSSLNWQKATVVNKLGNSIQVRWSRSHQVEWIKLRQFRITAAGTFSHLTPPPPPVQFSHNFPAYR